MTIKGKEAVKLQIILSKVTSDPVHFPIFFCLCLLLLYVTGPFPVIHESIEIEDGWFPVDRTEKAMLGI